MMCHSIVCLLTALSIQIGLTAYGEEENVPEAPDPLDAAFEKGLREVRIIHGRGVGVQRRTVRTLLQRDPRVESYGDAPAEAGGWGATWVRMTD